MNRVFRAAAVLVAMVGATSAMADTALVIANTRHDHGQTLQDAGRLLQTVETFEDAGFDVITVEDATTDDLRDALQEVLEREEQQRIVILASGHIASSPSQTWFMGREADEPSLADVSGQAVPVSSMLDIASAAAGRAIVMLGTDRGRMALGRGLTTGGRPATVPQGVTFVTGSTRDIVSFVNGPMLEPGADVSLALAESDDLEVSGFLSSSVIFLPVVAEGDAAVTPDASDEDDTAAQEALWEAARELDTAGSYQAYLDRYPSGRYATEARRLRDEIRSDPTRDARLTEEALNLNRTARQEIQRDLTILDYNPRGIDGIFGRGSRAAIANWQDENGYPETSYLDARQIARLSDQADIRAAELEEEARLRAIEEERADRAFWQATGQGQDESGLRAYLERYPDGLFAGIAEARLADIEEAARQQAAAQERAEWDAARAQDTVAAYGDYLSRYPDGAFAGAAEARISELRGGGGLDEATRAQLEARENALGLAPVTRALIERRLGALGLEPGRIDGVFDRDTRRAIRRYQRARDLEVTGFLDQGSVVRLMADTFGAIIRQ